ncbi:MAG: hypothetical protein HY904_10230 [Deltaproteobacteria bacterium]|nr:hypothetical protein [Deltaproteobacteria bacterium]
MAIASHQVGRHMVSLEDPDIVSVEMVGDLSPEEAAELNRHIFRFSSGKPFVFFLASISRLGTVPPEARKIAAKATENIPYRGMAFFGANFQTRVVMTLIFNAVNLVTRRDNPGEFFPTEPDARAWIANRRETCAAAI